MDELQSQAERQARELLPLFLRIFVFIYVLITGGHVLVLPDELVWPLTSLAFATTLVGIGFSLTSDKPWVLDRAQPVMVFLLLLMGINTMTHLHFAADIRQTTNFIFVMAASGFFLAGSRSFYTTLTLLLLSWAGLVFLAGSQYEDAIHYGFEILLGTLFAVFLHTLRRSQLKQQADLEATVASLNVSQQQLSAGESLLQQLIDEIPAGIIVRSRDTTIQFANEAAKRILGRVGENLVGLTRQNDRFVFCDSEGNPLPNNPSPVDAVLNGNSISNQEYSLIGIDQVVRHGLVSAFPLTMNSGDDVVVVAFVDITQRVEVESKLKQSEQRAGAILDSIIEGVISVDDEGSVTSFNPGAEKMTKFSSEEALGKPITNVFRFHEDETLSRSPSQRRIQQGVLVGKNGEEIAIELLVSEIQEEIGQGLIYTFRDVRDQLRYEQEQATVDKMSSLGLMAGGIAHDFNNLLTSVYGNLSLAEASLHEPPKARNFIQRSSESVHLATNLTKQLLTFATGSDPIVTDVDTERLLREATRFVLSGSSVAVSFSIDEEVSAIRVDAGQVQQAIGNIVLNAKQAMNDIGVIRISAANVEVEGASMVRVVIADEGPGIESQVIPRVFDPYFTTKETGTGLGLATTHSIVHKHGGSITVEGTKGEGTSFTLMLPATGSPYNVFDEPPEYSDSQVSLSILVMDDDDIVLETATNMLEHLGHRVVQARNGEEAIEAYVMATKAGNGFDGVIVDLTIAGGMGGLEASQHILSHDPDAKLIVSSGYSAGAEMSRYEELGFCARLSKPYQFAALEEAIQSFD